jgi:hypothetical protein
MSRLRIHTIDLTGAGDEARYVDVLTPAGAIRIATGQVGTQDGKPHVCIGIEHNIDGRAVTAPGGAWEPEMNDHHGLGNRVDVTLIRQDEAPCRPSVPGAAGRLPEGTAVAVGQEWIGRAGSPVAGRHILITEADAGGENIRYKVLHGTPGRRQARFSRMQRASLFCWYQPVVPADCSIQVLLLLLSHAPQLELPGH